MKDLTVTHLRLKLNFWGLEWVVRGEMNAATGTGKEHEARVNSCMPCVIKSKAPGLRRIRLPSLQGL